MTPSTPAVATNVSSTINTTNTTSTSTEVARNTLGQRRLREVPGVRLIVILKVISTTLPHNLLGDMAVVAVEENQIDLVQRFVRVGLDYPYFEKIDRVASFSADLPGVQSGASSTSKKSTESGVDTYVRGTDDASSVNIALLVSLFWCTLAVVSIVLLTKARSKIRNDNIEIENAGEPESDEHSDTAFRTSILRLIPLGSDVESAAKGSKRSLLSRSLRQSRTTGSGSLEKSLRDESFHYDNSLRDSSHRRSGLRSSMRQSLTMSQILGMSSEDDAPVRSSGVRRSGTAMRASMRRSMTNSNHGNLEDDALNDLIRAAEQETITNSNHDSVKGDDAPLRHSSVRKSGTAMRASMRRSMNNSNHDRLKDDDAPLRRTNDTSLRSSVRRSTNEANLRGSVRRNGNDFNLRGSVRRNTNEASLRGSGHDGMKDNDTRLGSSGVRRSGTAMRSSLRQSVTKANNDSLKDNDAKDGNALNISRTRNNLSKSVVFDDNLPSLIESDKGEEEQLEKPIINLDSEARTEEGENESRKVPERGQRKPSKLSQSMTAKDTMSFGISEEKKEEPIRLKNNLYKPQRMRRSGNEGSLRGSTNRGSADNLAGSDSDMGRLRRSENRGSSDNPRSMAKRAERRSLSQSISGDPSTTRRDSDGNTASLRRSNGALGSNDNLRGSTRRAPVANGLTDSTTLRRSSDVDNKDDKNLRGSARTSTTETNLRSSVRRSTNEANLRGSVRRNGDVSNLRGSVRTRASTNEASLRGSVRRTTNEANLRGSVRRNSDENDSPRAGSARTNEQQRSAGPRTREIV
uniref:Uncharacterized protein n=1 Tax=Skeletonema marinoi TaxID=267567 RepID=A0A7S2LUU4_9STRA